MGEGMAEEAKEPESSSEEGKEQRQDGKQSEEVGVTDQKQDDGSRGNVCGDGLTEVSGACESVSATRQPFTSLSQIDADLALARALQEQERAYMLLRLGIEENEFDGSASESEYDESSEDADTNNNEDRSDQENRQEGEEVDEVSDALGWVARDHPREEIDGSQFENDEAFARALQEAEDSVATARMMALAGIHDSGGDNGSESDNSEDMWEDVDPDNMTYEELVALGEAVGTESKGLAEHVVASLPVSSYLSPPHKDGTSDMEQCVICRHEYEEGDSMLTLPCKHGYHAECIQQWLTLNKVVCQLLPKSHHQLFCRFRDFSLVIDLIFVYPGMPCM
ncbi:hypothetical protein O6H91_11G022500 [Diphasiastrum complanatum]|uniref:Uncharacterized protein n=2 Tax=Diphasiastrum complanatum TaxID=34168 RepID=A0ACC2C7H5_DIPCM|nr:hypothetical protein O6H91_11G022500 [Diphasiastrum complanatum]KAJ7537804.1 hypothetical protein O6H91_11G022500 [Diphasiastrum complanatum]